MLKLLQYSINMIQFTVTKSVIYENSNLIFKYADLNGDL